MPNPSGRNGQPNGDRPPEDKLRAALEQYAREQLPIKARLERLQDELQYSIKKSKLKQLNAKYNIPTVRKPPPQALATTLICEKASSDLHRRKGPAAIKSDLALEGIQIPLSTVRAVLHDNDPVGSSLRNPKVRRQGGITCKVLSSLGIWHEVSVDGHEKLGPMALQMGVVGFHIYGFREKWAGKVLRLVCVPNARFSLVVGHIYLDFVLEHGVIPCQITFDGGSETPDMRAIQEALRRAFAPHLSFDDWPPHRALPSVHNIPIENLWLRWLNHSGMNLQAVLLEGKTNGLFNPGDNIDVNLFQWLWSQVVQSELVRFTDYWNCHRVRKQVNKEMPSGGTPNDFFARLAHYGGEDLSIPVEADVVEALRSQLAITCEEAFRFVDDEFKDVIEATYANIGAPKLTVQNGWEVYAELRLALRSVYTTGA